jgi:hypothetical protein
VLSGLLNTENEASAALDQALEDGFPLANLMFVEYCAEPTKEGVYWKHSVYKIGNALLAGPSVLDQSWLAKMGQKGLATDDQLHFEQQLVLKGVFADKLLPAFDAAQIDYGRADFALVNNRLAVYEINTNPYISLSTKHRTPIRVKTLEIIRKGYLEALEQLDMTSASSRPVMVRSDRFVPAFRRRFKFRLGTP